MKSIFNSIQHFSFISAPPLRSSSTHIRPNATWTQNGLIVIGENGQGNETNQVYLPYGLYVDDDQTVYIVDAGNHRIVEWKYGAMNGKVAAGGNKAGNGDYQLKNPYDVIVDKERDSLIVCDTDNSRVVRWPRLNGTSGETIISNILCIGLTMDENGFLYVVDFGRHEVRRYRIGDTEGAVVAGGNGYGNHSDQLDSPFYVFVDRDHSVYVSDWKNHRVMKWEEGAKQGIVVAGGHGAGNNLTQLSFPQGIVVDHLGSVYVADTSNGRIVCWAQGATQGRVIASGNDRGGQSNQLIHPVGLSFDRHGNFYVTDAGNHRVQKLNIEQTIK
jgi:sugar lactone lactonase YvrE